MSQVTARSLATLALAALAASGSGQSLAASTGGTLTVSAAVVNACLISNGTLAFGSYDPSASTALDGSTTLTLTCTPGVAYNIGMAAGSGTGATVALRKLTNGANTLGYRLYRDSGRTLNWGNTPGTDTLGATSSAVTLTNTINVYGQIPIGESVPAGTYLDSVAITVNY